MQPGAFIEKLFSYAKQCGFEAYEAYYSEGEQFSVNMFEGEIDDYKVAGSLALSFRGQVGGKMGYASTQVLDEDAVMMLVDSAKDNAAVIESEDAQFLYAGDASYPTLEVYSHPLSQVSAKDRIDFARALEKKALSLDSRVSQLEYCQYFYSEGSTRIVNSKGLDVSHKDNIAGAIVVAVAKEAARVNTGTGFAFSRDVSGLSIDKIAGDAVREAINGLSAAPVKSANYKIALRNDMAADLLQTFGDIFSAEMAQKGMSLLKGREGQQIASPSVTIVDDPHHLVAPASAPFDAEGVATYKKEVVSAGVFQTLLHNLKTAHKQGVKTTANASKASVSSAVDIAPSNFYIKPGEATRQGLLDEMGEGLLITEMMGMHSGADTISGDFSLGAKGFVVKAGKLSEAVEQITIAGNFYALLKDIVLVADDLYFGMPGQGCYGSPTILIKGLSVAGV